MLIDEGFDVQDVVLAPDCWKICTFEVFEVQYATRYLLPSWECPNTFVVKIEKSRTKTTGGHYNSSKYG